MENYKQLFKQIYFMQILSAIAFIFIKFVSIVGNLPNLGDFIKINAKCEKLYIEYHSFKLKK